MNKVLPKPSHVSGRTRKSRVLTSINVMFDWDTVNGVDEAIHVLMTGHWSMSSVICMAEYSMCGSRISMQHVSDEFDVESELKVLLRVVDFSYSPSLVVMTAGEGKLSRMLTEQNFGVVSNSVVDAVNADYHFDAMQPESYEKICEDVWCHVIIFTPAYEVLDAILSLAVTCVLHFVCCRVSRQFINEREMYSARYAWIKQLQDERRLLILYPSGMDDIAVSVDGCVWLILFASTESGSSC